MRRRNTDPYFTRARFNSTCPETGHAIKKDDEIAYYPADRKAYHHSSKSADNVRALQFSAACSLADANW
jgi:hypothetical protein